MPYQGIESMCHLTCESFFFFFFSKEIFQLTLEVTHSHRINAFDIIIMFYPRISAVDTGIVFYLTSGVSGTRILFPSLVFHKGLEESS